MPSKRGRLSSPRVLFVNINTRPDWTRDKTLIYFPIGMAAVMSEAIRAGYDCTLLDLQVDELSEEETRKVLHDGRYDVVAMGTLSTAYNVIKPLINLVKKTLPEAYIVVGNSVASARPDILLQNNPVDFAVVGEGEATFVSILDCLKAGESVENIDGIAYMQEGRLVRNPSRQVERDLDKKFFPLWERFDVEAYIQSATHFNNKRLYGYLKDFRAFQIHTSRGCPYRCTFCFNSLYYKENPFRTNSAEYIIEKMKFLKKTYNINFLFFLDELSFFSVTQALPFVDALLKENLGITFQANVRVGFLKEGDEDFAKKLRDAGCLQLNYSLESGSPKILGAMNKNIAPNDFIVQKRILDTAGIISNTSLVLGYPEENEETLKETFDVCYDADIFPGVGFLVPLPGTAMYNYALESGYITNEEQYLLNIGERQYLNLNMTGLTREQLMEETLYHLIKIRDKLGLELDDNQLICHMEFEDKKKNVLGAF